MLQYIIFQRMVTVYVFRRLFLKDPTCMCYNIFIIFWRFRHLDLSGSTCWHQLRIFLNNTPRNLWYGTCSIGVPFICIVVLSLYLRENWTNFVLEEENSSDSFFPMFLYCVQHDVPLLFPVKILLPLQKIVRSSMKSRCATLWSNDNWH